MEGKEKASMSAQVDVLAVMDAHVRKCEFWLPVAGADLCGAVMPDTGNPVHAANIKRHAEAVEARAAVASLIAERDALARAVCESVERCSPWAAKQRGTSWGALMAWAGVAVVAAIVLAAMIGAAHNVQ